jgi:hypothetical protein
MNDAIITEQQPVLGLEVKRGSGFGSDAWNYYGACLRDRMIGLPQFRECIARPCFSSGDWLHFLSVPSEARQCSADRA